MWLRFKMRLRDSNALLEGNLDVMDGGTVVQTFVVTSGLAGHQDYRSQDDRGLGPIPSCRETGYDRYWVATSSHYSSSAASQFFHITPDPVQIWGTWRSEFGIHADNGTPGSAGCIVLRRQQQWRAFQDFMRDYRAQGLSTISLIVEYSQ